MHAPVATIWRTIRPFATDSVSSPDGTDRILQSHHFQHLHGYCNHCRARPQSGGQVPDFRFRRSLPYRRLPGARGLSHPEDLRRLGLR